MIWLCFWEREKSTWLSETAPVWDKKKTSLNSSDFARDGFDYSEVVPHFKMIVIYWFLLGWETTCVGSRIFVVDWRGQW